MKSRAGNRQSKEDTLIAKIQEQHKKRSNEIARAVRSVLYEKQFKYYERAAKLYGTRLEELNKEKEKENEQALLAKTDGRRQIQKNIRNPNFKRLCKQHLSLIFRACTDAVRLIRPHYYENDLARFVTLAKLNGEEAMCKLYEFLNTPFAETTKFLLDVVVSRSLSQLSAEQYSRLVDPLLTLGNRSAVELSPRAPSFAIQASAVSAVSSLLQDDGIRELTKDYIYGYLASNKKALMKHPDEIAASYGKLLLTLAMYQETIDEDFLVSTIFEFYDAYRNSQKKLINPILGEAMRILIVQWEKVGKREKEIEAMMRLFEEMCKDENADLRRAGIRGVTVVGSTKWGQKSCRDRIIGLIAEINKHAVVPELSEDLAWLCYLIVIPVYS